MKITHNKSDLQFYYRPRDLRTVSSFLSHCKDYGVRVSKDELEYFEKNNLLLPAVWVDRGYGEMRKILIRGEKEWKFVYLDDLDKFDYIDIEPDPYYSSGGFSLGNDHWLKDYQEAGMTLDPVQKEFRAWDTYSKGHYFIKDKQRVKDAYEPFYSVSQLYPLAFLANNMQVSFKYESLFGDDERWVKSGRNVASFMDNLVSHFISPKMPEYCKLISILAEIKELFTPINRAMYDAYEKELKESGDKKEARLQGQATADFMTQSIKGDALKLMKKHKLTAEELADMRPMLLQAGTFTLDSKFKKRRKAYVKHLEEEDLVDAEDPYNDTAFINRFLNVLIEDPKKQKPYTVKQLLLETNYSVCIVCGGNYIQRKKTQTTCGSDACKKERIRRYKIEKRKTDPKYGI